MCQKLDDHKLKDMIRLIIDQCEPHELGQVKLHKALYYADMINYIKFGRVITGATYKKRMFGPTCEALLPALADLEAQGEISIRKVDYFGYEKKEFTKRSRRNITQLSDVEISIVEDVVNFVCKSHTASTISDFSHDIVWESVEMGQNIPYALAVCWIPTSDDDDAQIWANEVIESGVTQGRPAERKMEGSSPASLRERMAARA